MSSEFRCYKPRKTNDGAASKFQLSKKKKGDYTETLLFLEIAKQTGVDENGNAKFAWRSKENNVGSVTVLLGANDIGELLAVLNGIQQHAGSEKGLFHKNQTGNTVLNFSKYEKDGKFWGYALKASAKRGEEAPTQVQHMVSVAEGELLRVLLNKAVVEMYGW